MLPPRSLLLLCFGLLVVSQTTYTGCHNHSSIEYCYGPDGEETPLATYSTLLPVSITNSPSPVSNVATTTGSGQTTAVTECHMHETEVVCVNGNGDEVHVEATVTGEPPAQYTDCHAHDAEQFCVGPDGADVLVLADGLSEEHDPDHVDEGASEGETCHFHAGVEHCVAAGESESSSPTLSCDARERDYNVPLRVGTLFAILVTSGIGVFGPIFINRLPLGAAGGIIFSILKQFGTGVIVATAFVHLYTHAYLMFTNECLGALDYEATTSAIVMAGIFLAFLVEYASHRFLLTRSRKSNGSEPSQNSSTEAAAPDKSPAPAPALATFGDHHLPSTGISSNTYLSVLVMEAGIIFHSVLIGLTLVVAGDSYYVTLFIVIVFHQFFEGVALGSRIALLPSTRNHLMRKLLMAAAFALITPLGMAIGLGVLNRFNGNDPSTIVAIGTLDALSAGILLWVGVVDMWARDWLVPGGELVDAGFTKVMTGGLSLVAGMALMGLLGKWA